MAAIGRGKLSDLMGDVAQAIKAFKNDGLAGRRWEDCGNAELVKPIDRSAAPPTAANELVNIPSGAPIGA